MEQHPDPVTSDKTQSDSTIAPQPEPSSPVRTSTTAVTPTTTTSTRPTINSSAAIDATLRFFATASNETLGACVVGLCASTYLVLGRVGLVLIGAVGGVV